MVLQKRSLSPKKSLFGRRGKINFEVYAVMYLVFRCDIMGSIGHS
jgi:hypothetical protein